jgi:hypothetical protein
MTTPAGCDGCTLCCKLIAVEEIRKPRNQWCPDCRKGKGCGVYDTRPKACREFLCVWLDAQDKDKSAAIFGPDTKPDKCGVVIIAGADGRTAFAHVDPGYPNAWRTGPISRAISWLSQHTDVYVCAGNRAWHVRDSRAKDCTSRTVFEDFKS